MTQIRVKRLRVARHTTLLLAAIYSMQMLWTESHDQSTKLFSVNSKYKQHASIQDSRQSTTGLYPYATYAETKDCPDLINVTTLAQICCFTTGR